MSEVKAKKKSIYFPGLNGLRFLAALAVFITHVELFKGYWGYDSIWSTNIFVFYAGGLGVDFFFALSGFLITYLLFVEKERTGKISFKAFFIRRVLRIWPLYYLIVILAFFVYPHLDFMAMPRRTELMSVDFYERLILYLAFLPNVASAYFEKVPYGNMAWSVGVEEQFYILWPLLIKKFKSAIKVIMGVIVVSILIKFIILVIMVSGNDSSFIVGLKDVFVATRIECMAIGGIGAYLLYYKKDWLKPIYTLPVQILSYASIPLLLVITPEAITDLFHIVYAVIFTIIVLNIATNKKSILKLENSAFKFLGKISYGFYMYHMAVLGLLLSLWPLLGQTENLLYFNLFMYGLGFVLTVLISGLSYEYFEKIFLKIKKRFTIVESGNALKK